MLNSEIELRLVFWDNPEKCMEYYYKERGLYGSCLDEMSNLAVKYGSKLRLKDEDIDTFTNYYNCRIT